MKQQEFLRRIEERVEENRRLMRGGMPSSWVKFTEAVGLHYWKVGLVVSLVVAIWFWATHYSFLVGAVRVMIWR
jgi:hypothetical protein